MTPMMAKRSGARRGQMALGVVLFLLTLAFLGLWTRQGVALQSQVDAARFLAGQSAVDAGGRAISGMVSALIPVAADPKNPGFAALRQRLIQSKATTVDLTDIGGLPKDVDALYWKPVESHKPRHATDDKENLQKLGNVSVSEAHMKIENLRLIGLDPHQTAPETTDLSPDERVGLLRTEVTVSSRVGGNMVRRRLAECREMKLVLTGPPRPFDQMGLYIGDISTITDAHEVNTLRGKLLDTVDELANSLTTLTSGEKGKPSRLARILAGLPARTARDEAVPRLPEDPAVLYGLSDSEEPFSLSQLDLAADLKHDMSLVQTARSAYLDSIPKGGDAVSDAATRLAKTLNQGVMRLWQFQQLFRVLPRSQDEFTTRLAPYEGHIGTSWYDRRVMMELTEASPLWTAWITGQRELSGVFRVKSTQEIHLSGSLPGRAVLVIDAPSVSLSEIPAIPGRSLVTVVVTRGIVRLSGAVHACVLVGPEAHLNLSKDANICGSLIIPHPHARTEWVGSLLPSPALFGAEAPANAAQLPGRGAYTLAISPNPLWVEGERQ